MSRVSNMKPGPVPKLSEADWPQIVRFFDFNKKATVADAAVFFDVSRSLMEKTLRKIRRAKERAPGGFPPEPNSQGLAEPAERNPNGTTQPGGFV